MNDAQPGPSDQSLVERLRELGKAGYNAYDLACLEAADEIERLREELETQATVSAESGLTEQQLVERKMKDPAFIEKLRKAAKLSADEKAERIPGNEFLEWARGLCRG